MLAEERQNAIVAQVNREGSVRVKELSEQFSVTEDSIRKDLTALEKRGLLKKTYGGAMKLRVNIHDFNVSDRKGKFTQAKRAIAQKAAGLVSEGDTVFLDISTANLELARLLVEADRKITLVTNMVDVLPICAVPSRVKLIFLGGIFSEGKDGFVGAMTNDQVARFRFDLAFLGVVGVDLEDNSVATYSPEDASTKRAVLQASSRAYMLLETRKLNADGSYKYARVDEFTGAVTEAAVDEALKKRQAESGRAIQWL